MYICMYVCMNVYLCMYHTYIICICMYVHVCIYVLGPNSTTHAIYYVLTL